MLPGKRTNDGALFIAQGPPPAGTPLVGGIAVSHTGVIYVSQAFAFSPASLFSSGEQGAWYDPSDLTTMFQDRAGTTPVTADGQTVGKILDKSGNDNHAVAPSDAARPLYKTDGTYHWLQFDGVDDSLSTAAINFTTTSKISLFGGVNSAGAATTFTNLSALGSPPNGTFLFQTFEGADIGASSGMGLRVRGTAAAHGYGYTTLVAGNLGKNLVVTSIADLAGGTMSQCWPTHRLNGVVQSYVTGGGDAAPGGGTFANLACSIGRVGASLALSGKIYSLIARGSSSTTPEITDTETWINGKTGAY